jgi:signal peptidase I
MASDEIHRVRIRAPMDTHKTFVDMSTELLQGGQTIRFCAHGMSMRPTIQHGDFVTVEPIEASEVRRGDILLYRDGNHVIAHRVVGLSASKRFLLCGDGIETPDPPVRPDQVLGRVVALERGGHLLRLHRHWMDMFYVARFYISRFKIRFVRKVRGCGS